MCIRDRVNTLHSVLHAKIPNRNECSNNDVGDLIVRDTYMRPKGNLYTYKTGVANIKQLCSTPTTVIFPVCTNKMNVHLHL